MALTVRQSYRFGAYRLDAADRLLYREGRPVPLPPKVFDTLFLLVASRGHVLTKDEMMESLWPDTFVEEATLAQYVSLLRKALGEDANWIQNLPRRGYRFTATVEARENGVAEQESVSAEPAMDRPGSRRFRAIAAGLLVVAMLAAAMAIWLKQRSAEPRSFNSLAVLPFRIVADSEMDYLADGITEALITRLTNLKGLRVVSHSRVRRFKGSTEEAAAIGRQLGVEAVIEGTVRTNSGQSRVTVHGVDSRTGLTMWAFERREVVSDRLLDLEGQLAESAAQRVRGQLTENERMLVTKPPSSSAEARDLVLKAGKADAQTAERLLTRAVELDPEFADAYGWLAFAQQQIYAAGLGGPEILRSAALNAERALSKDGSSLAAIRALGRIHHSSGRAIEGLVMARRALEEHPDDLDAIAAAAEAYFRVGLYERAIPLYKRAVEGEPGNSDFRTQLGRMFLYLGDYRQGMDAIAPLRPEQSGTFGMFLYAESGRMDAALRIARVESPAAPYSLFFVYMRGVMLTTAVDRSGALEVRMKGVRDARGLLAKNKNPWTYAFLGMVNASLGRRKDAIESTMQSLAFDAQHPWILLFAAQTHSILGLHGEAIDYLKRAVECGFLNLPMIEFHSRPGLAFHGLRDKPEFGEVRADMAKRIDALRARQ